MKGFCLQSVIYKHRDQTIKNYMASTAVSQECEAWSVRLIEEHKLRVFEKRVLRKIIWCTTDIWSF